MGGSSSSSTEQSQTSYPQWTQDAQANTYSTGKGMLENFLRNPQYQVAGFGSDSLKGFDLARDSARSVFETGPGSVPGAGGNLNASMGTAASVDASMNPYLQNVVDTTRNTMTRDWQDKDASLAARSAASAVRGSGGALARGQLARGAQENIGNITAQLMAAGYDKQKAMELSNAQMQQQTGLANQSAENAMRALGLDYGLKGAQVNDQMRTSQLAREQTALERILQGGQMQEGKAQQALDIPWTALQRLMGLTPQQMNSQTISNKETESEASPADTFGKIAGGLGSLGIKFSDARMKTNIRRLGDLANGLGVYEYQWKSTGAREVGLIAQEVQRYRPDAVVEAPNGFLMVDYGKAVGEA